MCITILKTVINVIQTYIQVHILKLLFGEPKGPRLFKLIEGQEQGQ